jgi:hypothetical protein
MFDRIVRPLSEDFAKIGFGGSAQELRVISERRLDESLYSVPTIGTSSDSHDPIDGPVVTMELFNRIADLDFDSLSEGDCDAILDGLRDKELPSGDSELAEAAEAVVKALVEMRIARRRRAGSRRMMTTKRTSALDKRENKLYSRSPAGKKQDRNLKRKQAAGKFSMTAIKGLRAQGMTKGMGQKAAKAAIQMQDRDGGLALELESMLGEQVASKFGQYGDTVSRVARIMTLIESIICNEVGDVLESAFSKMETALITEGSHANAVDAFGPTLKVIARCLEEIDAMGND